MKTMILAALWIVLLGAVLMVAMGMKKKKRLTNPYMIIFLVTIVIVLWRLLA